MKKKFLCFLLAICMFLNFTNVSVLAGEFGGKASTAKSDLVKENFHERREKDSEAQTKDKHQNPKTTTQSSLMALSEYEPIDCSKDGSNVQALLYENEAGGIDVVITGSGLMQSWDVGYGDYSPFTLLQWARDASSEVGIQSIEIGCKVLNTGYGAFYDCDDLTTVTFAEDEDGDTAINRIGGDENYYIVYGSFDYCASLTSITIPESVTSIGNGAFGSSSLSTVTFEGTSQLTSIGDGAFSNCSSLTEITIPKSVTSIGNGAFGYSSLSTVTFEGTSQLTSIGDYVFDNCSSLTEITIPESVTSIGEYAFAYSSLSTVTFATNDAGYIALKEIEDYAFYDCPLQAIRFDKNPQDSYGVGLLAYIMEYSNWVRVHDGADGKYSGFYKSGATTGFVVDDELDPGYRYLWSIVDVNDNPVEATVINLNQTGSKVLVAFSNISGQELAIDVTTTAGTYEPYQLEIPCGNDGYNLTAQLDFNDTGIDVVITGSGLMRSWNVWNNEYSPFTEWQRVIESVGIDAVGIQSIEIGCDVENTGYGAFYDCDDLTTVTFDEDEDGDTAIERIGGDEDYYTVYGSFEDCSSLTEITIPESVTSIGDYAFWDCNSLSTVTFGADKNGDIALNEIGDDAFYDCPLQAIRFEGNFPSGTVENTLLGLISAPVQVTVTNGNYNGYYAKGETFDFVANEGKSYLWSSTNTSVIFDEQSGNGKKITFKNDIAEPVEIIVTITLAAPTGLKLTSEKPNELTASWSEVTNASGYEVQLYKNEATFGEARKIENAETTEYTFENIEELGPYTFKVKALGNAKNYYNDSDFSEASEEVVFTETLPAPTNLNLESKNVNELTASWKAVENANGYKVELYKDGTELMSEEIPSAATTEYTFEEITNSGTYMLKVMALGDGNYYLNSDYSETSKEFTFSETLPAPTDLTLTSENPNELKASWSEVENASGYKVELYKDGAKFGEAVEISGGGWNNE